LWQDGMGANFSITLGMELAAAVKLPAATTS